MSRGQQARCAAALAWCPPELLDDYLFLKTRLSAREARAIIEDQIAHAGELTLALCWQCERTIAEAQPLPAPEERLATPGEVAGRIDAVLGAIDARDARGTQE